MKRFWFILILLFPAFSFAVTYNPSDLVNGVKRSQVITELYLERWNVMENSIPLEKLTQEVKKKPVKKPVRKTGVKTTQEQVAEDTQQVKDEEEPLTLEEKYYYIHRGSFAKYVDLYFHGESIFGYSVPVGNYGNKELTLFRVFGSTIIKFEDLADLGFAKWGIAVSAAGFRYGLTKKTELSNSNSSGIEDPAVSSSNFSVRDYLYNQTYDDLLVLTNIFKGFGYIHTGILFNDQVDPGLDGMMGTADDIRIKSSARLFLDSNLFGFFFVNLGYNSDSDKAEYATTKIDIFSVLSGFGQIKKRATFPDLYLGYTYTDAKTAQNPVPAVHLLFAEAHYNYYNQFYLKGRADLFLSGRQGLEKDYAFKQLYAEIGYNFGDNHQNYFNKKDPGLFADYYLIFGLSYFVDKKTMEPTIGENDSPKTIGYSLGLKGTIAGPLAGASLEARISKNYSTKLMNLVEAYDHWIAEVSLQISF